MQRTLGLSLAVSLVLLAGCNRSTAKPLAIEVILTGLDNPRGIAVGPAGELYVAEAGTGYDAVDPTQLTGKLTLFNDLNGNGDLDDPGEADRWFSHFPTYNAQHFTDSVRDEVGGPSDLLLGAHVGPEAVRLLDHKLAPIHVHTQNASVGHIIVGSEATMYMPIITRR